MRNINLKNISTSLCFILLFNSCLVNLAEANIWRERQKSIGKSRQTAPAPPQLAGLPLSLSSLSATNIIGPLPEAAYPFLASSRMTKLSKKISGKVPTHIKKLVQSLPASFGSTRKIIYPEKSGSRKTVIHIQDVHLNSEAQENIGKSVKNLLENSAVDLIALEGAFGPVGLAQFHSFPFPNAIKTAADYLLREKKISGAVHAALTTPHIKTPVVGIDDPAHYNANVEAYRHSATVLKKVKVKEELDGHRKNLEQEKTEIFNPALAAFDRHVEAYRQGQSPLGRYVQFLSSRGKPLTTNIQVFLEALGLESNLDFSRVEVERTRLVTNLAKKLDKEENSRLLNVSIATRLGQIPPIDFYEHLRTLCQNKNINLAHYPAMNSYIQYVLLSDGIDQEKLFHDVTKLEEEIHSSLVKTPEEKNLITDSKRLDLTGKLLNFALTREEWEEYKEIRKAEGGIRAQFEGNSSTFKVRPTSGFRLPDLKSFESFYEEAEARDQALTENLLSSMGKNRSSAAVLVTGGFHSSGIQDRLKQAGVATITFVPKITKVESENGTSYLSVFTQEKTPLDRLFDGEKLFVAPKPDRLSALPLLVGAVLKISNPIEPDSAQWNALREIGFPKTANIRDAAANKVVVQLPKADIVTTFTKDPAHPIAAVEVTSRRDFFGTARLRISKAVAALAAALALILFSPIGQTAQPDPTITISPMAKANPSDSRRIQNMWSIIFSHLESEDKWLLSKYRINVHVDEPELFLFKKGLPVGNPEDIRHGIATQGTHKKTNEVQGWIILPPESLENDAHLLDDLNSRIQNLIDILNNNPQKLIDEKRGKRLSEKAFGVLKRISDDPEIENKYPELVRKLKDTLNPRFWKSLNFWIYALGLITSLIIHDLLRARLPRFLLNKLNKHIMDHPRYKRLETISFISNHKDRVYTWAGHVERVRAIARTLSIYWGKKLRGWAWILRPEKTELLSLLLSLFEAGAEIGTNDATFIFDDLIDSFPSFLPIRNSSLKRELTAILNGEMENLKWSESKLLLFIVETTRIVEYLLLASKLGWLEGEEALHEEFRDLFGTDDSQTAKFLKPEAVDRKIIELSLDFLAKNRDPKVRIGDGFVYQPQIGERLREFYEQHVKRLKSVHVKKRLPSTVAEPDDSKMQQAIADRPDVPPEVVRFAMAMARRVLENLKRRRQADLGITDPTTDPQEIYEIREALTGKRPDLEAVKDIPPWCYKLIDKLEKAGVGIDFPAFHRWAEEAREADALDPGEKFLSEFIVWSKRRGWVNAESYKEHLDFLTQAPLNTRSDLLLYSDLLMSVEEGPEATRYPSTVARIIGFLESEGAESSPAFPLFLEFLALDNSFEDLSHHTSIFETAQPGSSGKFFFIQDYVQKIKSARRELEAQEPGTEIDLRNENKWRGHPVSVVRAILNTRSPFVPAGKDVYQKLTDKDVNSLTHALNGSMFNEPHVVARPEWVGEFLKEIELTHNNNEIDRQEFKRILDAITRKPHVVDAWWRITLIQWAERQDDIDLQRIQAIVEETDNLSDADKLKFVILTGFLQSLSEGNDMGYNADFIAFLTAIFENGVGLEQLSFILHLIINDPSLEIIHKYAPALEFTHKGSSRGLYKLFALVGRVKGVKKKLRDLPLGSVVDLKSRSQWEGFAVELIHLVLLYERRFVIIEKNVYQKLGESTEAPPLNQEEIAELRRILLGENNPYKSAHLPRWTRVLKEKMYKKSISGLNASRIFSPHSFQMLMEDIFEELGIDDDALVIEGDHNPLLPAALELWSEREGWLTADDYSEFLAYLEILDDDLRQDWIDFSMFLSPLSRGEPQENSLYAIAASIGLLESENVEKNPAFPLFLEMLAFDNSFEDLSRYTRHFEAAQPGSSQKFELIYNYSRKIRDARIALEQLQAGSAVDLHRNAFWNGHSRTIVKAVLSTKSPFIETNAINVYERAADEEIERARDLLHGIPVAPDPDLEKPEWAEKLLNKFHNDEITSLSLLDSLKSTEERGGIKGQDSAWWFYQFRNIARKHDRITREILNEELRSFRELPASSRARSVILSTLYILAELGHSLADNIQTMALLASVFEGKLDSDQKYFLFSIVALDPSLHRTPKLSPLFEYIKPGISIRHMYLLTAIDFARIYKEWTLSYPTGFEVNTGEIFPASDKTAAVDFSGLEAVFDHSPNQMKRIRRGVYRKRGGGSAAFGGGGQPYLQMLILGASLFSAQMALASPVSISNSVSYLSSTPIISSPWFYLILIISIIVGSVISLTVLVYFGIKREKKNEMRSIVISEIKNLEQHYELSGGGIPDKLLNTLKLIFEYFDPEFPESDRLQRTQDAIRTMLLPPYSAIGIANIEAFLVRLALVVNSDIDFPDKVLYDVVTIFQQDSSLVHATRHRELLERVREGSGGLLERVEKLAENIQRIKAGYESLPASSLVSYPSGPRFERIMRRAILENSLHFKKVGPNKFIRKWNRTGMKRYLTNLIDDNGRLFRWATVIFINLSFVPTADRQALEFLLFGSLLTGLPRYDGSVAFAGASFPSMLNPQLQFLFFSLLVVLLLVFIVTIILVRRVENKSKQEKLARDLRMWRSAGLVNAEPIWLKTDIEADFDLVDPDPQTHRRSDLIEKFRTFSLALNQIPHPHMKIGDSPFFLARLGWVVGIDVEIDDKQEEIIALIVSFFLREPTLIMATKQMNKYIEAEIEGPILESLRKNLELIERWSRFIQDQQSQYENLAPGTIVDLSEEKDRGLFKVAAKRVVLDNNPKFKKIGEDKYLRKWTLSGIRRALPWTSAIIFPLHFVQQANGHTLPPFPFEVVPTFTATGLFWGGLLAITAWGALLMLRNEFNSKNGNEQNSKVKIEPDLEYLSDVIATALSRTSENSIDPNAFADHISALMPTVPLGLRSEDRTLFGLSTADRENALALVRKKLHSKRNLAWGEARGTLFQLDGSTFQPLKDVIGDRDVVLDVRAQDQSDLEQATALLKAAAESLGKGYLYIPVADNFKQQLRSHMERILAPGQVHKIRTISAKSGFYIDAKLNLDLLLSTMGEEELQNAFIALQGDYTITPATWEYYKKSSDIRLVVLAEWLNGLLQAVEVTREKLQDIDRYAKLAIFA